ncbi:raffinose/stachyose/melibiose transport system substrate-binding protein [Microbacterium sp. ru370.1]|uniref:ABC transporter substrate-binding protein n=1 Tax=unclassified Microbacterium TaxID=2609290 RepID=UPI00088CD0A1|nr:MULTISPECIES: ABC transporter substrate-binding protein [unclassified Microbacterium]SDO32013.1 raffinose/stachyose/melibiose transport system substrate-binding protein [Microbacterium sp. ru370.1]SIT76618.1 raffinose/stachyose/melibiose transport system substrate-binding protein [Microbacterium sp. RU1D]
MSAIITPRRTTTIVVGVGLVALALAGCSGATGGDSADGKVEITFLTTNGEDSIATGNALISAFEKANPDITVTLNTRPGGTEGDNLVKTQLSTGEMDDVFFYNTGSLFQAINPDQTLVNLADQPWASEVTDNFKTVVSTENGTYGAPLGTSMAGGIAYNTKVFSDLGLSVPTDWSSLVAAAEKIKAAGITPIEQTYGDTWTSQLFLLADFGNVHTQDENWADDFTNNKAKFAEEPALAGFTHLQDAFQKGLFNTDFATATAAEGSAALATGKAAMYPMLSSAVLSNIKQSNPDAVGNIGFFAMPADKAADTTLTVWEPNAVFIPTSTEGAKLDAAKKFVAFVNSSEGCDVQNANYVAGGPFSISSCSVPADAAPMVAEIQKYVDEGKSAPALEFLSPVKGPNLENIAISVGSGISSAQDGAAAYDDDVKKQAQQLGLAGW